MIIAQVGFYYILRSPSTLYPQRRYHTIENYHDYTYHIAI